MRISAAIHNWLLRHQHPASQILHAIGIPMAVFALILAGVQLAHDQWSLWWRPTLLLFVGYLLQWIGHKIEGNTMGELILVCRILGKPYTAIAPPYQRDDTPETNERP